MTHKVRWQISLNNGETFTEGRGRFISDGSSSAFRKLEEYIEQNDLLINSISLITEQGRTFNLPSSKNPRFKVLNTVATPKDYDFFRIIGRDHDNITEEHYTVGVAKFNNHDLQVWVSENNPSNSWSLVVNHE